MSDRFISTVHIQKLGHKLLEIRERALINIVSKLEHGFLYDNDLARSKEILSKLFEWFEFEPCTQQVEVLKLIRRILQSETGSILIRHFGKKTVTAELNQIRTIVEPKYSTNIDELVKFVNEINDVPEDVPPLQSDMPLSYRTGTERSEFIARTGTSMEGFIQRASSYGNETRFVDKSHSRSLSPEQAAGDRVVVSRNETYENSLNFTLKWQVLITADRNVLKTVENRLQKPSEPVALLNSCEFFYEVILQDFPNEIFLQRPLIIQLFHGYLRSPTSTRLTNSILNCLLTLTKNLCIRIRYYEDPCMWDAKQDIIFQRCSATLSPTTSVITPCHTERSYMQQLGSQEFEVDFNGDDYELFKTQQLTIPQYCFLTMHCIFDYICFKPDLFDSKTKRKRNFPGVTSALILLDELVNLLSLCLKSNCWEQVVNPVMSQIIQDFQQVLIKFASVLEHFRLEVVSNDGDKSHRLIHLHILCTCTNLLIKFIPLKKADVVLPRDLKNSLANILLDSSLARLYPDVHETILLFVKEFQGHFEIDSLSKYKEVKIVCDSITSSIKLFRTHKSLTILEAIKLTKDAVFCLEFHRNLNFITIAVGLFSNKLPLCNCEHEVWELAEGVILQLLAHNDSEIQEEMYKLCHKRIVTVIGTRLNTSGTGAPGSQILFLIKSSIIVEICAHGLKSANKQIQKYANEILIHILKCKILVSDTIWNHLVEALISALPILACFADKNSTLGRAIINILDPDTASSLNIPTLEILKGNLRLLFVEDTLSRIEAISRLCWMLGSQNNSRYLLPRLNSLQDKALGSICQIQKVVDINKSRPSQHFYQPSALVQVLELLKSDNVEPVIRRSALTQVSVMVEDPLLHPTFVERDGVKVIVQIMDSALIENDYKDYVDCIISAVAILKNVCLYNSIVRQDLCNNIDVYFYILRGLFIFCSEERMRQNCSILLCLLLFNEYILGSPTKVDFSIPFVVSEMLTLPFTSNVHWRTSKHTLPSLAVTLLSDKWCASSIQVQWNSEWFGGFKQLLKWNDVRYSDDALAQFDNKLCLTNADLLMLKSSSIDYCILNYLNNIQNATSHSFVIESINKLQAYLRFYILIKSDNTFVKKDLLELPWELSFLRFLSAPPANDEDTILLISCLKLLTCLVPLYTIEDKYCWVTKLLKDPTHCLPNLLQVDSPPEVEQKILHRELLNLITVCVWHEQHFFDLHMPQLNESSDSTCYHIIEIITDNLNFTGGRIIYNLAYLDAILSCLVHLTSALGWTNSKIGSIPKDPIPELILQMCELAGVFYCEKGSSACVSLMGLNITRNVFLILNHLLAELQFNKAKGWEMCFIGETAVEKNLLEVLCSLVSSRDVVLRAAVWQLLAGLAVSPRAAIELVQEIKMSRSNDGVWEMALSTLLDTDEASIVKENATKLLTNLTSHTMSSNSDLLISTLTPSSAKQQSPTGAILHLLNDYKFFVELESILGSLYLRLSCNSSGSQVPVAIEQISKGELVFAYTKNITQNVSERTASTRTTSSENKSFSMYVTPCVVKTLAVFINNLLILAPDETIAGLQENNLIKMFFRCISNPLTEIDDTKELSFYCDVLEMNAAVCALLTKAVANNQVCLGTVLQTRDCLSVMLSLLNPSLYFATLPQLTYLRNRLWTEIFCLIGTLLDESLNLGNASSRSVRCEHALTIVSTALSECGHEPFLQTLCEAISCNSSLDLQHSALASLTSLLCIESITTFDEFKLPETTRSCISMQELLDKCKTPRTLVVEGNIIDNLENVEPSKSVKILWKAKPKISPKQQINLLQNVYFGNIPQKLSRLNRESCRSSRTNQVRSDSSQNESLMAGGELCRILLHLYDVSSLKSKENKFNKKKSTIINTLTSILCVSREAKKLALRNGLVEMTVQQLRDLHIKLSLESVECLRRVNDKRRVSPVLKELSSLVGLVTNFMLGDEAVKCAFSVLGFADLLHKLWVWFCVDRSLLTDVLKMLCTFTTDCYLGCQSLPLTSSVAGSGPRKVASNVSLLNEIVGLVGKEMDLVSRSHELTVLELSFHVLHNSCAALECRCILTKSNLLQCLSRLHPAITKRQKPWDSVELIWLEFLLNLTGYPEGQLSLAKTNDALDLVMMFTTSTKIANKKAALLVIRNVAFHLPNRPRLLNSDEFLNILQTKLATGNVEEQNIVVTIIWALSANSQKSKLVLKCAGLDVRLQDCLKRLSLSGESVDPDVIHRMHFVLGLLKDGDKLNN